MTVKFECDFKIFLGFCLILPVISFYPNRLGLLQLSKDDHTLQDITEVGILTAVAEYFEANPIDGGQVLNPGDLAQLEPLTASNLYGAYYGEGTVLPNNIESAIQEIVSENIKISSTKAQEAFWHMNGEQLKRGNDKILQMRASLNGVLSETVPDYKIARNWIGRILHIMQTFYSNTDWLEMEIYQHYLKTQDIDPKIVTTYADLGIEDKPFLAVENSKSRTCLDCENGEFECFFNRHKAIRGIRYTSGYLSGQDVQKPEGIGKCSHGGIFDITRNTSATGGINKQTSNPILSPHYYYHNEASRLAIEATTDFFIHPDYGLLNTIGEAHFRGILNLGTGSTLAMAIDSTGSMSEEIAAVKDECIRIVNKTAGTVNAPFNYVVVTFNDPDFGPAFVTKDPNECISYLSLIKIRGGGDCPEFALSGIELALQNCLPNSDILVFTDADAKDSDKMTSVAAMAKDTNSHISFILTGTCSSVDSSTYDIVAEESGGVVYRGTKSEISEIVGLLDLNVGAALVYVAKKDVTSSQNLYFVIDGTLNIFIITISGQTPRNILIYAPSGIKLDLTSPNVTVNVDISTVLSIYITTPERGEWMCGTSTNTSETYDVEVTANTVVDFQYTLLTVDATTGLATEIDGSPIAGAELIIEVKIFGVDGLSSVEHVDLLSPAGEFIDQISLMKVEKTTSDVYTATFLVPNEAFSVRLQATDTSGNIIQRLQPSVVRPEMFQLLLASRSTNEINPGTSVVSTFKLINTGRNRVFNIVDSITGGGSFISSIINPSSVFASNSTDGNITHTLYALPTTPVGMPVTVTVRAEEPTTGSFNYFVYSISVNAVSTMVVDNNSPVLSDSLVTGLCSNDKLSKTVCDKHTWTSTYEFKDDIAMGSITYYPPIDIQEVMSSISGRNSSVTLSGTCCCPLLTVTGVDTSGNIVTVNANLTDYNAPIPVCLPSGTVGLPPGVPTQGQRTKITSATPNMDNARDNKVTTEAPNMNDVIDKDVSNEVIVAAAVAGIIVVMVGSVVYYFYYAKKRENKFKTEAQSNEYEIENNVPLQPALEDTKQNQVHISQVNNEI